MDKYVTSLETSKKLKAAGFPQGHNDYYFFWAVGIATPETTFRELVDESKARYFRNKADYYDVIAAPIAEEIAEQLPRVDGVFVQTDLHGWRAGQKTADNWVRADTMAEALAALYLQLKGGINNG